MPSLRELFLRLKASEVFAGAGGSSFKAVPISGSSILVGMDGSGRPALLVRAFDPITSVAPTRLKSFEARFGLECDVMIGEDVVRQKLILLRCLSAEAMVGTFFLAICESVIAVIGANPSQGEVASAVDRLASIFLGVEKPSQVSLTGLVGELIIILECENRDLAIASWRRSVTDRYDFVGPRGRIEAKATTRRARRHSISYEQANPDSATAAYFSSCFVEYIDLGVSLQAILDEIVDSCADPQSAVKLLETLAATVGTDIRLLDEVRIDLALARSSLSFYSAFEVPAVRDSLPVGVSGLRFESDFDLTSKAPRDEALATLLLS